jgi:hypothetical protein
MPFSFIKKITLHLVVFKQTNKRSRKPKGQPRDTDNVEHRTKKKSHSAPNNRGELKCSRRGFSDCPNKRGFF